MSTLTTMKVRLVWWVWEMVSRWGPWSLWMGPWGWTAGWSVKNRMRCWTWLSQWAPSSSQPSRCHWGLSWINMGLANWDCWEGKQRREETIQTYCDVTYGKNTHVVINRVLKRTALVRLFSEVLDTIIYFQHLLWIVLSTHCLWSLQTKWWVHMNNSIFCTVTLGALYGMSFIYVYLLFLQNSLSLSLLLLLSMASGACAWPSPLSQ